MRPTQVTVLVRNDLDKQSSAELMIESLSAGGRFKRALKPLAICWGAAILCVLIPVLHFFLVPSGILLGLFLFYRQMTFHELLVGGLITCPQCSQGYQVATAAFNWPKRENCPQCEAELIVRL
jgi:hypothetical protein